MSRYKKMFLYEEEGNMGTLGDKRERGQVQ